MHKLVVKDHHKTAVDQRRADSPLGHAYEVVPLSQQDIEAVARTHVASFGDSFLARMGVPFLRHYFRAFLDYPRGCGLVCRHRTTGEVAGFVCGTEDVTLHYRVFLRRLLPGATPAIVIGVCKDRRLAAAVVARVWRVARLLGKPRHQGKQPTVSLPPASLMTIGVDPLHRRRGIGEMLARAFVGELAERGVRRVKLGVRDENMAARRLYERLGWRPVLAEQTNDDSTGWMYVRDIDTNESERLPS